MKNKNIILLSIIFILLLTLSVYVYVNYQDKTKISVLNSKSNTVFSSQKECERETGEKCRFQNCDLDCPEGFKKGWTAPISKGASCGLSVSNISRNQKVSFPLEIKGVVDNTVNCDSKWTMFEGQAGTAELYFNHDDGWKQITNGIPVPVSEWMTDKTDFSVVLNFNNGGIGLPDGTEMKVVFKEEDPSGKGEGDIFELPVILQNSVDTSNWKTYKNEEFGFEIKYPKDFLIQESKDGGFFNETNSFTLSINTSKDYQKGTDFSGAFINISPSSKTDNCYRYGPSGPELSASKEIGDTTFHFDPRQPISDSAMGGQRGWYSLFTTISNRQCYRISKSIGYRDSRGFADPPYSPHFDENKVNIDLDKIISTFKFTK